jgi:hypothetical protein
MLPAFPIHGENVKNDFNLELKNTSTNTKIKYFFKALELDPVLIKAYENC